MENQKYNEYRVTELPIDNLKAGDKYFLLLNNNKFKTFIVGDDLGLYEQESEATVYLPVFTDEYFDI